MKTAVIASLLLLAPSFALAGTYQYTTVTGEVRTIEAPSIWDAYAQAMNIKPFAPLVEVSAPAQLTSTESPTGFNLKAMSVSELRQLRSEINDELESREVNDEPSSNTGGDTSDNTTSDTESLRLYQVVIERYDNDGNPDERDARIVYVRGNNRIASVSVNGESLEKQMEREMGDSCYGPIGGDKCGGYAYRFRADEKFAPGSYTIRIEDVNGDVENATASVEFED